MTVTELPTQHTATAAAANPHTSDTPYAGRKRVLSKNPWMPVIAGAPAGITAVAAAFAEFLHFITLRNWLIVTTGVLLSFALLVLAEECQHVRNKP